MPAEILRIGCAATIRIISCIYDAFGNTLHITIRLIRCSLRKILRAGRATRAGVFPFCIYVCVRISVHF